MSLFVLMAGGTGGHLFPAMSLAQELRRRGHVVDLMTDHRVGSYGGDFPARDIHVVPSATPSVRNPLKVLGAGLRITYGIGVAMSQLRAIGPDVVIGFGGYPVFPPFLAAALLGIPGLLHEQNAVMGRANRALARSARRIALSYPKTLRAEAFAAKSVVTGNPIRDKVKALAGAPFTATDGELRLVVFGGSQGARALSDIVPAAVALLPAELRARLRIVQQARQEDLDRVAEVYRQAKVNVELATFFADLPEHLVRAHLVICRSGASSISDLTAIGRPAILVPLPGSLDADQKNNALFLEAAGGGWIEAQATLSPPSLATRLTSLFSEPELLRRAASAALSLGQPDAVQRLADEAEGLVARGTRP